jgi:hypothetical protein
MTIANMKQEDKDNYDRRFQSFLSKMIEVAKYAPKERYLYPVMEGVPFKDLEVTLDLVVMEHAKRKANDNGR